MIITLIKKDRIYDTYLPQKVMGQYFVTDVDENNKTRQLLSIEGEEEEWVLKSNAKVELLDDNNNVIKEIKVSKESINKVSIKGENDHSFLYAYEIDRDLLFFKKLVLPKNVSITFGRDDNNTICYKNDLVSGHHFTINNQNGILTLINNSESNGTYVNDIREENKLLKPGDIIFVMKFKLIVGDGFIAINNPDSSVVYDTDVLSEMKVQEFNRVERKKEEPQKVEYFYRSPRFKREIVDADVHIDSPPNESKVDDTPAILQYGPSVTMALSTTISSIISINMMLVQGKSIQTALPTIMIAVVSLMGTLLWPFLLRSYTKRKTKKLEKKRQEKYREYLHQKEIEIDNIEREQTQILIENNITFEECTDRIMNKKPSLYERMSGQNDFLTLNIGIGNVPMKANIQAAERGFSLEQDNLQELMYKIKEKPHTLMSVPISYSLIENYFTGIIGTRNLVENFTKRLLIQLCTLHSYDEVKLVYIGNEETFESWEFVKWLPHIWDDTKTMRFLATNRNEVKTLSAFFEPMIEQLIKDNQVMSPRYVIVVTDKELYNQCDFLNTILKNQTDIGFSVITLFDKISNLPKECTSVIDINEKETKIYNKNDISGDIISFVSDCRDCENLSDLAIKLANIKLDIYNSSYALPTLISFLEMYGVSNIEHLNVMSRWNDSDPINTLQAPVGINTAGDLFYLDLHEKFHGPHGLIAGMTGSGKSEFIITYILSLALNYHPDEVSFILIDYKGGGLAGAFENPEKDIKLPHLSGTITNLSGNQIKRSLVSIESELKRRQAIFNDARNKSGEGTIDIYKYQQLRREGVVSEPLPHLFIISDEFAELKAQQPDFMDELIQTARIGRSLGVHLILATQKPSGVVNDQIWSNSKFRVCLKVQTASDSNEMLKRPDAAEITQTGRFYLQVGYNELFEMGQSAWAGAPYDKDVSAEDMKDDGISIINHLGQVIRNQKLEKKESKERKEQQVSVLVRHLSDIAKDSNCYSPRLWLDPIPSKIYTEDLEQKYNYKEEKFVLNPIIGEYDQPSEQKQDLLTMPLSKYGNVLLYGAVGSGKTTLLHTLFDSLIRNHTSEEVNIYIIDLGSGTLKYLEKAPHVGDVLTQADPEKVACLFQLIMDELESRKALFADYGGTYQDYIRKSGKTLPNIIFAINNYNLLLETVDANNEVMAMIRDCFKYGIFVILTSNGVSGIRYTLVQNIKLIYTLQLNDASDYNSVVGKTYGLIPEETPGRGLFAKNEVLEFQTALPTKEDDIIDYVQKMSEELQKTDQPKAKRAPFVPDYVSLEYVNSEIKNLESVPIGLIKENIEIYKDNLSKKVLSIISANEIDTITPFLTEFVKVLKSIPNNMVTVIDTHNSMNMSSSNNCYIVNNDYLNVIKTISNEILNRHKNYQSNSFTEELEKAKTSVFIINGINDFMEEMDQDTVNIFDAALKVIAPEYKIYFIFVDDPSGMANISSTDWYKRLVGTDTGLWIGEGFDEQTIISINGFYNRNALPKENNMGVIVNKGKEKIIKVLQSIQK